MKSLFLQVTQTDVDTVVNVISDIAKDFPVENMTTGEIVGWVVGSVVVGALAIYGYFRAKKNKK